MTTPPTHEPSVPTPEVEAQFHYSIGDHGSGWAVDRDFARSLARRLALSEAANAALREALQGLVRINELHNDEISKIIAKPIGWKDDYLNPARDILKSTTSGLDLLRELQELRSSKPVLQHAACLALATDATPDQISPDLEWSAAMKAVQELRERVKELEKQNKLLCVDWAEDHTHLQKLCREAGCSEFIVEGDPYGVPGIIDLANSLRDALTPHPQPSEPPPNVWLPTVGESVRKRETGFRYEVTRVYGGNSGMFQLKAEGGASEFADFIEAYEPEPPPAQPKALAEARAHFAKGGRVRMRTKLRGESNWGGWNIYSPPKRCPFDEFVDNDVNVFQVEIHPDDQPSPPASCPTQPN